MNADGDLPIRRKLPHDVPLWVPASSKYFITINSVPRGHPQITGKSAELLQSAFTYHKKDLWYIHLFLLMPDHLHAILSFPPDKIIRKTVSNWKRYNARFHGIQWQSDFFEHRLRDETSFREKFDYIQRNPSRNGLCEHLTDWPHYIETNQLER